jgi:hypothetical protein
MLLESLMIVALYILVITIFMKISEKYCRKPYNTKVSSKRIKYGRITDKGYIIINPVLQ